MKTPECVAITLAVAVCAVLAARGLAQEDPNGGLTARPLPLSGWTIAEDCGTLSEPEQGFLSASYQSGNGEPVDLYPSEPIVLPDDVKRLRLWFVQSKGKANISWLIRDNEGNVHEITPRRSSFYKGQLLRSQLARGRFQWPMWTMTESSWLGFPDKGEVRRRLPSDEVEDALARIWPGPFTLAGIRITPVHTRHFWLQRQEKKSAPLTGRIWFTGLSMDRTDSFGADFYSHLRERARWARGNAQILFLDELVDERGRGAASGRVRWEVAVRQGYQGREVWVERGEGILDRNDPAGLFKQAIALPKVAPGRYWIRTKAWRSDGTLAATRRFQWFVLEGPDATSHAGRRNAWSTGRPHHVFAPETRTATLTFAPRQAAGGVPGDPRWTVAIMDYQRNAILEQPLTLDENGRGTVDCPVQPGFDYFAVAELRSGADVLDREPLHFGVGNGPETPGEIPDSIPDFKEWFEGDARINPEYGYGNNTAFNYPFTTFGDFGVEDFRTWLEPVLRMGTDTISFTVHWDQVELLPGVFRWDIYDRMLKVLEEHGMRAFLFYSHGAPPMRVPVWVDDLTLMRDQFGDIRSTSSASIWDREPQKGLDRFLKKRAEHYRGHPAVAGYIVRGGGLSPRRGGLLEGHPDYSTPAREAFRAYLEGRGEKPFAMPEPLTMPGCHIWDLPPDLSAEWRAFTEFQVHSLCSKVEHQIAAVREVDNRRGILVDRKASSWATESLFPVLAADGSAALKNEGSPSFYDVALRTMGRQLGVPYVQELHIQLPVSRSVVDATYFRGGYSGNGVFWLARWTPKQLSHPSPARGGIFKKVPDIVRDYLPSVHSEWDEFVAAPKPPEPDVLVFGSRASDFLGQMRRGIFHDIDGIAEFSGLFRRWQVPAHMATEYSPWVNPRDFKLVFACGRILTEPAVDRLVEYARGGGHLVLIGEVGRYTAGRDERNLLQARLEGCPHVRSIPSAGNQPLGYNEIRVVEDVDDLLGWAGAGRPVRVTSDAEYGFEVLTRGTGNRLYIAAMRRWEGRASAVYKRDEALEKYGHAAGMVHLNNVPADSKWKVEKFFRDKKDVGIVSSEQGTLRFQLDPAEAGEVQLFRLTRDRRGDQKP